MGRKRQSIVLPIGAALVALTGALLIPAAGNAPSCFYPIVFAAGDYFLPWPGCERFTVSQGNGEGPTHWPGGSMEYAIDFDLPEGWPTVAAKGGRVAKVEGKQTECGDWQFANKANYVVIDHGDGTSALYLHLKSVAVSFGQEVRQGQIIGEVGKTGWTDPGGLGCDPHLHFQLQGSGPSWFSQSIPIQFSDVANARLKRFQSLHSQNYEWGDVVETIFWQTYRARISGSQRLDSGRRYLITIAGTMSQWEAGTWGSWTGTNASRICEGQSEKYPMVPSPGKINGPVSADPEYLFAYPIYSLPNVGNTCRRGFNNIGDRIDIRFGLDDVGSLTDINPIDSTPGPDHSYQYIAIGRGYPLKLFLGDTYYEDNYGIFLVTIAPEKQ